MRGQPLRHGHDHVCDVDFVSLENARMHAPAYRGHDEQPHLVPGPPLRRPGIEVRERPGKHQIGESGMLSRSEEHTSELQSQSNLVCRLLLEKKKKTS